MIIKTRGIYCTIEILRLLSKNKSKYTFMFKTTKVSHTTLQLVLEELMEKGLIEKYDIGHKKVDYEITKKGLKLFDSLMKIEKILR